MGVRCARRESSLSRSLICTSYSHFDTFLYLVVFVFSFHPASRGDSVHFWPALLEALLKNMLFCVPFRLRLPFDCDPSRAADLPSLGKYVARMVLDLCFMLLEPLLGLILSGKAIGDLTGDLLWGTWPGVGDRRLFEADDLLLRRLPTLFLEFRRLLLSRPVA